MLEQNFVLSLTDDPFFKRETPGEVHPYSSMSREDVKREETRYIEEHKQGYHNTVKRLETVFKNSLGGASPFSVEGWNKIIRNDTMRETYIDVMANDLFKSNETWKTAFKNTVNNSIKGIRTDPMGLNNFPNHAKSLEGLGAMATYQNVDNFSNMTAFGIAGWFGRSKILELYHPIENNTMPLFSYKFILDYIVHPVTRKLIPLPLAWRDDSTYGLFDLPRVKPLYINESETPQLMDNATKIKVIDKDASTSSKVVYKEVDLGDGWVKAGHKSNLIIDSCDGSNNLQNSDGLEPTVAIEEILYIADYDMTEPDNPKPVYKKKRLDLPCHESAGQQDIYKFWAELTFKEVYYVEGGTKKQLEGDYVEKIFGDIYVDTGDFAATSMSSDHKIKPIVVAYKPYALVSDNGNNRPGVEHQTKRFVNTLRLEYTNFGHIPLTPYVLDNYNLGNDSLGYVATMTDYMTKTYTITRDTKAEHNLLNDFEKSIDQFPLYPKLNGFKKQFKHNFALTQTINDPDLYKQSRFALRERILRGLSQAETELFIPQTVSRGWVMFGPDITVQAFADIDNGNQSPDNSIEQPVNSGKTRFGFNIDEAASFIDKLGRNVKLIGCIEQRWQNRNIVGGMKSFDMNYPTFLYYAYMFRIFTGIDPQYRGLSAVLFYGRDGFFSMLQAHCEVILSNYDDSLYENAIESAKTFYAINKTK